jgi:hypothetical protein
MLVTFLPIPSPAGRHTGKLASTWHPHRGPPYPLVRTSASFSSPLCCPLTPTAQRLVVFLHRRRPNAIHHFLHRAQPLGQPRLLFPLSLVSRRSAPPLPLASPQPNLSLVHAQEADRRSRQVEPLSELESTSMLHTGRRHRPDSCLLRTAVPKLCFTAAGRSSIPDRV